MQPPGAIEPERVGGADCSCGVICDVRRFQRDEFVRQRDIGAGVAALAKRPYEIPGLLRLHGLLLIGAVDTVQLKPVAMDYR